MEEVIVTIFIFLVVFGIFYLHYATRNKERMALIEKGADASIFFSNKNKKSHPIWKVLILNMAVLCMGIGVAVFLGAVLHSNLGIEESVAYPGTIFLIAGISLFVGFSLSKKLIDKE